MQIHILSYGRINAHETKSYIDRGFLNVCVCVCVCKLMAEAQTTDLEDLVEAVALLHNLLLLRVQDGAAHQQMEVLAGQTCPHHLIRQRRGQTSRSNYGDPGSALAATWLEGGLCKRWGLPGGRWDVSRKPSLPIPCNK